MLFWKQEHLLTKECATRFRLLHVRLMAVVSNLVTCCHLLKKVLMIQRYSTHL